MKLFNFFIKLGAVFGCLPWIDQTKKELIENKALNTFSITTSIVCFVNIISKVGEFFKPYNCCCVVMSLFTMFLNIRNVYCLRKGWTKCLRVCEMSNRILKAKSMQTLESGFEQGLILLGYVALFLVIKFISHMMLRNQFDYLTELITWIAVYYYLLTILFLRMLIKGFRIVNEYSKSLHKSFGGLSINSTTNVTGRDAIFCQNLYNNLYDLTVCFNKIFGWILLTNLHVLLILVLCIEQNIINEKRPWMNVVTLVLIISFRLVSIFLLISFHFLGMLKLYIHLFLMIKRNGHNTIVGFIKFTVPVCGLVLSSHTICFIPSNYNV